MEIFHDESWKCIHFGGQKVKGQGHEAQKQRRLSFLTARRYASAEYAIVVCPSVRLFVCLSVCLSDTSRYRHCTKWINAWSRKQCHTIAQRL